MKYSVFVLILALLCDVSSAQMAGSGVPVLGSTYGGPTIVGTCGSATGYSNTLTVTVTAQGGFSGSGLTNWRSLFIGDSHLATTGNGGFSLSSGTDIVPCTAEDGTGTIIPYRLTPSSYVAATGALEMQIKFPAINKSSTAKFYLIVGKSSATDFSCVAAANCATTLFANLDGGTNAILQHYDFGSGTGNTAFLLDATGNAGSVTNHGCSQQITSSIVNSYDFCGGGSTNYIDSGSTLPALTNFTLSALVKMATNPAAGAAFLAANSNAGATANVSLVTLASGGSNCGSSNRQCIGAMYAGSGSQFYKVTTQFVDGIGWFHLVATHTAGSPNLTLYINAVVDSGTIIGSGPNDPATSASTFQISRLGDAAIDYFDCATCNLDELEVANKVWTADEVLFDKLNLLTPTSTYTVSAP